MRFSDKTYIPAINTLERVFLRQFLQIDDAGGEFGHVTLRDPMNLFDGETGEWRRWSRFEREKERGMKRQQGGDVHEKNVT